MLAKKKSAFTLIELLVVIAIIGILATVSILALTNARAKSRDAKRAGDMKQVQTALELFFNDKGRYPTAVEWSANQIYSTSTIGTSTYMQIIPTAPTPTDGSCTTNQNSFSYSQTESGNSYTISFCLGGNTGTLNPGQKCLTPGGIVDASCCSGSISYSGQTYNVVEIGSQCWLKENLNVGTRIDGTSAQTDNGILEKYCYNDDVAGECAAYGGFYQWDEAMQYSVTEGTQGICPPDWHVPSDAEQNVLDQYLTDSDQTCDAERSGWDCASAGTKLLTGGTSDWEGLLSGFRYTDGSFNDQGTYTYFWSSSVSAPEAWERDFDVAEPTVSRSAASKEFGFSVRCLRD